MIFGGSHLSDSLSRENKFIRIICFSVSSWDIYIVEVVTVDSRLPYMYWDSSHHLPRVARLSQHDCCYLVVTSWERALYLYREKFPRLVSTAMRQPLQLGVLLSPTPDLDRVHCFFVLCRIALYSRSESSLSRAEEIPGYIYLVRNYYGKSDIDVFLQVNDGVIDWVSAWVADPFAVADPSFISFFFVSLSCRTRQLQTSLERGVNRTSTRLM